MSTSGVVMIAIGRGGIDGIGIGISIGIGGIDGTMMM